MDGTSDQVREEASEKARLELRRLRVGHGMSLSVLARQVPCSTGHLSKIENGRKRITPQVARRLDEVLKTGGVLLDLIAIPKCPQPADDESDLAGADVCPYPGLPAFGPQQAQWFFGREQVTADLIARLDERLEGGGLLAVVAPSGAGKSSLLAAGLIPALTEGRLPGSRAWLVVSTTPGAHPLVSLVERVAAETGSDLAPAAVVAGGPDWFTAFLAETLELEEASSSARVVLIVDQFEEIFTECRQETERQAFIAALDTAAQSATALVVLGVRADFYGQCLAYPALLAAMQSPLALGPMSVEQLRAVITRPAQAEGLGLEPGLVELLLRDLGVTDDVGSGAAGYDPGALPLLAHALRVTWHQRDGQMLTVAGYRRTGGLAQALATTAESAYNGLSSAEQLIAQQVLLRLVNVSDQTGSGDTRRRLPPTRLIEALPLPESAEAVEKVLEVFGRARLLTFDTASVEITHEALLRAWPRLAEWISADRAGLRTHQQLSEAADAWEQAGRDPSRLYRGTQLATTRDWATSPGRKDRLSTLEKAYLGASLDQEQREQQAARRRTRRMRQLIAGLSVLLVVATSASVFAFIEQRIAAEQRDLALSSQVAGTALAMRATNPALAAQLGLAAYRRLAPTAEARGSLLSTFANPYATRLIGHTGTVRAVAFSGHLLASAGDDGMVRLWDVNDPHHAALVGAVARAPSTVFTVAFSPSGGLLASAGDDGMVRLWDVNDPRHPVLVGTLPGASSINSVAFSPGGDLLASAGNDGMVRLWDVRDPRHTNPSPVATLSSPPKTVYSVTFSPHGHILASATSGSTVRLWDVNDPRHPTLVGTLPGADEVDSVTFSPDGHSVAAASLDNTVRLWDVNDLHHPIPVSTLPGHAEAVTAVAFNSDGHILASASNDNTVRLWDVSDLGNIHPWGPPLTGHTGAVTGVAFGPDGHTLASTSFDTTARLWDLPGPTQTSHTDWVTAVAFSPDRHTLATASFDTTVRLWDVSNPHDVNPLATLTSPTGVYSVAFSSDGHTLASASYDKTVRLWDVSDPRHPSPLSTLVGHFGIVSGVAFSPDRHTLASSSYDTTARLWDISDLRHPRPLATLQGHRNGVDSVAFSPDGHTLASASSDNTVRLWDVSRPGDPHPLGPPLLGHTNTVHSVTFSPDGQTLASASFDNTVWLWDVSHPGDPHRLVRLIGHTSSVYSVAFSSDGHTLASASYDSTVRLWDVHDRRQPSPWGTLTGHTSNVDSVAFSPDGHTLASGSYDHTARLWETDVDRVAARICSIAAIISTSEWGQYVPNVGYWPPCAHA